MHTFKIEVENQDVLDKVLWFLNSLQNKGVKISQADDEFFIDVDYCLSVLKQSKHNFRT